jgi:hypothetical protein
MTEAEQVARILENDSPISRDVAARDCLRKKTGEFEVVIQSMKDASETHIIARFFSLSGQNQNVQNLLSHFKDELKSIARDVLNSTRDDETILSRIIEVCYNQSLSCSGILHHDQHYTPLEEARSESPEHENLLQVDESYAEAERVRKEQEFEVRKENRDNIQRAWIKFWSQALSQCPGGPTLFFLLANPDSEDLPTAPKYLFRTFDSNNSGKSDDIIVASSASIHKGERFSKTDLLSL